ncbi:unnamed protein product [Calicophoron daubneyi]|uniref:RING-type domain-containing protein n=1 Tax=Calicophoron daubneyi TaxID=300641 RepID=A0AAV2TIG9_CALDB
MPPRKSRARKPVQDSVEEPEERMFVNPSTVSPHLFCPICQEPFVHPMRAPCGHSFCKTCIEPWLKTNPICPVDRKGIHIGSLHHDFIVESMIGDYTVACPWRSLGCDFIGPLHSLPTHKKQCLVNPGTMPPVLREHALATSQPPPKRMALTSQSPSTSQESGVVDGDDSVVFSDDEDNLPPAPPPNLLLRLYHNSDTQSRDLLCDFIGTSSVVLPSPRLSRGGGMRARRRTTYRLPR